MRSAPDGQRLQFFDFASRAVRDLAPSAMGSALGLAASPDDRYLVYAQLDQSGSDLMLVEGFH